MEQIITSVHNARVKLLVQLQQKSSERRHQHKFVVEGQRELRQCIDAGLTVECVFFCPSLMQQVDGKDVMSLLPPTVLKFEVSQPVYSKIAYRATTEGIIAVVHEPKRRLEDLHLGDDALVVVLEGVEKPGNVGAVLRSADAAGADAVILCDARADLYNPNLIRASLGAVFSVPCLACSTEECIDYLQDEGVQILTAQLQDSEYYYDCDMTRATALVMGTESTGLTEPWRHAANAHIRIPMLGRVDSLNVSVSTAVLLYEAVRQRQN